MTQSALNTIFPSKPQAQQKELFSDGHSFGGYNDIEITDREEPLGILHVAEAARVAEKAFGKLIGSVPFNEIGGAANDLVFGELIGIEPKKEKPKDPEQQAKESEERHRVINFNEEKDKRLKPEPKAVRVDGEVMPSTQVIDILGLNSATDITDEKGELKAYYEIAVSNVISFNDAVRQREARKIIASPGKKTGAIDSLDKAGESKNHYTQVAG